MDVRTTLTIDEDLAARIQALQRDRRLSLRQVINDALRRGLPVLESDQDAAPLDYETKTWSGGLRLASLDDVGDVLALAEGERLE